MIESRARYENQPVICLSFALGDKVAIHGIDEIGTVYSANISRDGIEYCVKWFNDNGNRVTEWLRAEELKKA